MIVVVGAGLAGLQTVVALRAQGFDGALTLLGAEAEPPYDRPPLTKALLFGETDDTTLEADWAALDVDLRLGLRATSVHGHTLRTDAGELAFDRCVLATGAQPRRLPGAGTTLRTKADALALRAALTPGARLVVIGAGWIGAEVATAGLRRGVHVTVIEGLDRPLAGALPAEIGSRTLPWWSAVDLRTSMPDVWAVGDCAAWQSARYGTRMLVEHWDAALHGPTVVAANVLGGAEVWDPVPYFWSEQWGRMLQYAGHHPAADRVVWRDDGDRWAAFWLAGDRLVAALTVDRPRDLMQARKLMQRDATVDADRLADPAVAVKDAVAGFPA